MYKKYKSTRDKSKEQESILAKKLGIKKQSNSGATRFQKGDLLGTNILIECKTTMQDDKKSFSIKKEWIEKNKDEAFQMSKYYSAIAFNFGNNNQNYFVIDENMFQQLLEIIENE